MECGKSHFDQVLLVFFVRISKRHQILDHLVCKQNKYVLHSAVATQLCKNSVSALMLIVNFTIASYTASLDSSLLFLLSDCIASLLSET